MTERVVELNSDCVLKVQEPSCIQDKAHLIVLHKTQVIIRPTISLQENRLFTTEF